MAHQKVKTKTTKVKTRVKKDGSVNKEGYSVCRICGGSGVQKTPKKKKK